MFDGLRKAVAALQEDDKMGTLESLFAYYGRSHDYLIAMGGRSIQENLYVQSLLGILCEDSVPLPSIWDGFSKMWPKKVCCDLRERPYIQRGEVRSFVVDKDPLRTLVGSTIHSLLQVKEAISHDLAPYSDVAPKKTKHLVSETLFVKEGFSLCILFGDISSFSASLKNVWIVLIGLINFLEDRGIEEVLVIDIKGSLLETSVLEILRTFLYLASACATRHEQDLFYSQGAMLGIAGVDTLCKVTFGLFLRLICRRCKLNVSVTPQVGGDDFKINLIYKTNYPGLKCEAINYLDYEIRSRVGFIKELNTFDVPMETLDIMTPFTYCKKVLRVIVEATSPTTFRISLASQWPIPLMRALLTSTFRPTQAAEFWETTRSAPWVPDHEEIRDGLYALFAISKCGLIKDSKTVKYFDPINHINFFTAKAMEILSEVRPIRDSLGKYYKLSFRDKLSSVESDRLEWVPVSSDGGGTCVTARGEISRTVCHYFFRRPDPFAEIPESVLQALLALKDLLDLAS